MAVKTEAMALDKNPKMVIPQSVCLTPSAIVETITINIVTFNTMRRYVPEARRLLTLPEGSTVLDVLRYLEIPPSAVFTVWVNGQFPDNESVSLSAPLRDGDHVALSGPIPFSRFYQAPVC